MAQKKITLDFDALASISHGASVPYRPPIRGQKGLQRPSSGLSPDHSTSEPSPHQNGAIAEGSIFSDKQSSKSSKNFKVVVRVRPLNDRELSVSRAMCLKVDSKQVVQVHAEAKPGQDLFHTQAASVHSFVFDRVYDRDTTQEVIYDTAVKPIVHSILQGYNGSIIAYGQTGTGKTHTIEGGEEAMRGVIPRVSEEIFKYIEQSTDAKSKFLVRASFLQIYNERITDLLHFDLKREFPGDKAEYLKVREAASGGVFVDNLSEHIVRSPPEVYKLLQKGAVNRTTAATKLNHESSRSHAVFTIIVEHSELNIATQRKFMTIGKLNLVDLAGSERVKASGAEGVRMEEAIKINTSLAAFGKVILALTTPGSTHTPYRDSKLTRLLQDSLGGNCKTVLITTVTPAMPCYSESLSSLKFANKAKSVKNHAVVNEDQGDQTLLSNYEKEIRRLRKMLEDQQLQASSLTRSELVGMESQLQEAAREKAEVMTELEKRSAEVAMEKMEKDSLKRKIMEMEESLITGGTKAEDTEEFKEAVRVAHEQLQNQYEEKLQQLEREREELEQQKERLKAQQEKLRMSMGQIDLSESLDGRSSHLPSRGRLSSSGSVQSVEGSQSRLSKVSSEGEEAQSNDLEDYVRALLDPDHGLPLWDPVQGLFTGAAAVRWFQENMHGVTTVEKAAKVGQRFIELGVIAQCTGSRVFGTQETDLYQFLVVPPPLGMAGRMTYLRRPDPLTYGSMNLLDGVYGRASSALSLHAEPTAFGEDDFQATPLHHAARKGERSVVKSLVATYGVDCRDSQGRTPLMYAVIADKSKCCETLLRLGADPNSLDVNGRTALLWAAYHGHTDSMRSILKSHDTNPDIADPDGRTVLHWATKPESIECLRVVAKFSANIVDRWDNQKTTPLHWAVLCGHPAHVSILIKSCGANPATSDGEGRTALHYAVTKQTLECCQVLVECYPKLVDIKDAKGRIPLHLAVTAKGSVDMLLLLLSVPGIDINCGDCQQTTAVHWSVVHNRSDMLQILIKHGGKTSLPDSKKMLPIHYAMQRQHTECIQLLQPAPSRQGSARISVSSLTDLVGHTGATSYRSRRQSLQQ